jgi:hypothetical protein
MTHDGLPFWFLSWHVVASLAIRSIFSVGLTHLRDQVRIFGKAGNRTDDDVRLPDFPFATKPSMATRRPASGRKP